ncbi:toxin glutamine deamidase domain-containing protein [Actinoplanes friuliensis]|uniref:toxin glutamine deamidase domain-containing protein n=1 Tax=Actinoplanes friuliensis TaxID=196914 RepID=UPI00130DE053|nr:toxin glutamine deamidase domain-containing protein [Actinoplanes friuliensis]
MDDYLRNVRDLRIAYANARRQDAIEAFEGKAESARRRVRSSRRSARVARFLKFDAGLAAFFEANVDLATADAERAESHVAALRDPNWTPPPGSLTEIAPHEWHRTNTDRGHLAPGAISVGNRSMLTGSDHPPSIDGTRQYGSWGGLRAPLAQHQLELENAMPRDANGDPARLADPRSPYFQLLNDGGSTADPTRGINCQDCVLSFFDTYMHGRPRVSAPRTFDAYGVANPQNPLYGEDLGSERVEHATGGRFQSLCPMVDGEDPAAAKQKVDQALTDVSAQLLAGGHGSFAFLVNAWESGAAHAWAAVNQNGQILFVDPQSGVVTESMPPYKHEGRSNGANMVALDALVVDGHGNPMPFLNRPDGLWHPQQTTLAPPPPRPTPIYYSSAYQSTDSAAPTDQPVLAEHPDPDPLPEPAPRPDPTPPTPEPVQPAPPPQPIPSPRRPVDRIAEAFEPKPAPDRIADALASSPDSSSPPKRPEQPSQSALERRSYSEYLERARTTHEQNRRDEYADYLIQTADTYRAKAVELNRQADAALAIGATVEGDHLRAEARLTSTDATDLETKADRVRAGELAPERVDVEPADWIRINNDVGTLASGAVETGDQSALTGNDIPPPIDQSRPYGKRGGLRAPLAVHQLDLEKAMPREADGKVQRLADPRSGEWFGLANDGGPTADPTRGINCVDGVLSLFDTYIHGRPRVSAPRTFDSYAQGNPTRPMGAEDQGLARIETTVQGEFQGLCPYVGGLDPQQAKQAVDTAMTNLQNHLYNAGHGAFAFIVTDSEQGTAHAWAAVNQNGTILFLDPQTGRLSESTPLYSHQGTPNNGNVVSMDAVVVNSHGEPAPLPYHQAGLWSRSSLQPLSAAGHEPTHDGRSESDSRLPTNEPDLVSADGLEVGAGEQVDPPTTEERATDTNGGSQQDQADLPQRIPSRAIELVDRLRSEDLRAEEQQVLESLTRAQQQTLIKAVADARSTAELELIRMRDLASSLPTFEDEERPALVDDQYRVKSVESLARKYQDRATTKKLSFERFLDESNDRVRFSIVVPERGYVETIQEALHSLRRDGYQILDILSFWNDGKGRHNGLNVTMKNSSGFTMELQFPTARSRKLGKDTHHLYEVVRLPSRSAKERVEAFFAILALSKYARMNLHQPPGVDQIEGLVTINTSFGRWTSQNTSLWLHFSEVLNQENRSLAQELNSWTLDVSDLTEMERLNAGDERADISLSGVPGGEGVTRSDQPHRVLDAPPGAAESGGLARDQGGMDLRSSDSGETSVQRRVRGRVDGGRSDDSRIDGPTVPPVGAPESGEAHGDERRGHQDGLGLRPATARVDSGSTIQPDAGPSGDLVAPNKSANDLPSRAIEEETLGGTRSDIGDGPGEDRLSAGPQGRPVGRNHEPDRLPGPAGQAVPSSVVERPADSMDLRSGSRGADALRRQVPGSNPSDRPRESREDLPRKPEHGAALGGDPAEHVRRGREDGLELRPTPPVTPAAETESRGSIDPVELAAAQEGVRVSVAPHSAELADVVVRLLEDHQANDHRLNLTEALVDADRRPRALELLVEVARRAVITEFGTLEQFLSGHPGVGDLFEPVEHQVNTTPDGLSRKKAFEAEARRRDPVRGVGPAPTLAELTLLDDYGIRLRRRVLPAATLEVEELASQLGGDALVSGRSKRSGDLLDKVRRMTSERPNRPARLDYRVGDVIDAVGLRLTVPDMDTLSAALELVKTHFGDRILEIENMYAQPKAQAPSYRVIPVIISIETDGLPCTYELQLTTQRASVAADIEHNTIYKPYVAVNGLQREAVEAAMEEAAALDQLETIERDGHGR